MTPAVTRERPLDDIELVRRIAARDEHAFETMMRRHNRMLYRLTRSILKNDAEAEDAVQDAYLSAYRSIASFRGGASLGTWLARIAINEAYARLRKRKRAGVVVSLDSGEPIDSRSGAMANAEIDQPTVERPDEAAARAELRKLLERKIDALPDQFRTVFMLRDVEELSVDETAELLDVPAATVRTRAFRARAMLRAALEDEFGVATVTAFGFDGARCDRIVAVVIERIRSIDP